MAVVVVGQILGKIVALADPANVEEGSSTGAPYGEVNIQAGIGGAGDQATAAAFISLSGIAEDTLAELALGNCTITISQGAGTLDVSVSQ